MYTIAEKGSVIHILLDGAESKEIPPVPVEGPMSVMVHYGRVQSRADQPIGSVKPHILVFERE